MEERYNIKSMSPLVAFIIMALILGYPRFYGTEFPLALLIVPFYLVGFGRFFLARGLFSIIFLLLFGLWVLGGVLAFLNGQGEYRDIFFHVVVSVKILLNIFFGYVVYQIVRARPSVLAMWLIFQSAIIIISMFSSDFYSLMLGFISPRSAEVFQHIYGLRALGFGIFHVDGALTIVLALFFSVLLSSTKFVNGLLLLLLPLSMAVARSAIVAYAIMSVFRKGLVFKVFLVFALLVMVALSFYVESGPLFEATEIFRNLFQYGELESQSVNVLLEMYVLPNTISDWLFGNGQYFSGATETLEFYKGTDVGYLRILYFSGVGSVFIFILLNTFFLIPLVFSRSYPRFMKVRMFAISLIVIFLIINLKGLQSMPIFAMALYMYSLDLRRNQGRTG
ncbi:hypothetical protein [Pseudomonas sp.]|uniref:hypothetical protein n=1 Tax=Pseudomonas sp. TaxID=306 RepID=UPI002731D53C|nr:hypothetical protein [Pseudomonas sp.]MDP2244990.1 hypothetical protein [Pseudomonas sp.]